MNNFENLLFFESAQFQKCNDFEKWKFRKFFKIFDIGRFLDFKKYTFLEFSKSEILEIFLIGNFWNFPNWKLLEFSKLTILVISQIENCSDFLNWQFLEFSKSEILEIFVIGNFRYCPNCEINKFLDFFQFGKPEFGSKIANLGIVRPLFDIPHYSQFCQFSYVPFDINQFSQFLFPILVVCKFGRPVILKFDCLKF